ncbi:MAG TPA: glycosyltransferase family 39 protein [Terracidiphilus sp.]|nr:glycosyltransferase family 39 protein [Terracidiphilus sp.]
MGLSKRWIWVAVCVLVAIQAVHMVVVVHRESLTFDEADHMFAGYMMWKTGDYGLNPEHPPLAKLLATAPIAGKDLWVPKLQDREFKVEAYLSGRDWHARNDGASGRLVFRMRLAAGLLALALSLVVFFTAREFFGETAGLIALVLVTLDPNVLAHSALVTTDIGVSLFFLASIYAFYRYVKQPSMLRLAIAGLMAGLLLATKHSGILLAPMLFLLIGWEVLLAPKGTRGRLAARLSGAVGAMAVIGVVVLWAFYGFRYAARPAGLPFPTVAEFAKPLSHFNQTAVMFFARLHLLPESWLIGLVDVKRMAEWYPTFVLGAQHAHGVWFYFPVVILVKTTLGLLALVALALFAIAIGKLRKGREVVYLLVPALFYLLVAIVAGMDIGARHVLPVDTFIFVLAAGGAAALAATSRRWAWAIGILVAAHVISSLAVFPNYMAYANEAWGGPKNVHNLLSDANVDWAQQLYQVKAWQDRHPGEECWFAYFAYPEIDPATYGITCRHLPTADSFWLGGADVTPPVIHGHVLLSAGDLSGCEFPASHDNPYLEFQSKEPSEVIDYGVFVYSGTLDMKKAATLSRVQNAYQLLGAGKAPEALALVKEAVTINPQDIQAQSALGNISAAVGQKDEARKAWEAALGSARQLDAGEQASVVPELEEKLKKL